MEGAPTADPVTVDFAANEDAAREYFASKGFEVLSKADKEKAISEAAGSAVAKTHGDWESVLAEVSGKAKPAGVKGIEWAKGLLKKEDPIVDPNPAPAKTVSDDKKEAEILTLRKSIEDFKTQVENEKKTSSEKTVRLGLDAFISNLQFDGEAPEVTKKKVSLRSLIKSDFDWKLDDDNNLVPYNKNGEIHIDPTTQMAYEVGSLIKAEYGFLLAKEKPVNQPISGTGTKSKDFEIIEGEKVYLGRTHDEVVEKLKLAGMLPGSKQYREALEKSFKASKLRMEDYLK